MLDLGLESKQIHCYGLDAALTNDVLAYSQLFSRPGVLPVYSLVR